jgi:hypothetical protein
MRKLYSLCVYCGSSNTVDQKYRDVAADLGKVLAENDITLVFGGGRVGLMGILSDACMQAGGRAVGIMTEFLYEHEGAHTGITELHVVKSMHERKKMMFERADGFVILPGGFGTLDEAFEIMTWRQVGLHSKPIVWLNAYAYWDGLFNHLIPHLIQEGFAKENDRAICEIAQDVASVLPAFYRQPTSQHQFVSKWG